MQNKISFKKKQRLISEAFLLIQFYLTIFARSGGETGAGTLLLIGGNDCRKANTAFKSSSVNLATNGHGIGGRISRPFPKCLPLRIVLINVASLHAPIPVAESGVRL